jgi:hypothetical protein
MINNTLSQFVSRLKCAELIPFFSLNFTEISCPGLCSMFTGIVRRLRIMKGVDIARNGGDNTMNSQLEVD